MQIGETRGEILRLVAKLRASQRSASGRATRASPPPQVSSVPDSRPKPRPAIASAAIPPPPRERRPSVDDRVRHRHDELNQIRKLRQRLEEQVGARSGLQATLERIEKRVIALEDAFLALAQRSRFPPRKSMTSRAPRAWSSSPPNRRGRKSSDPAELAAANEDLSDCMFSGAIEGQLLSDMLQLVSSNSLTGMFVVENDDGRTELFFEEGKIYHAVGPDLQGELAFFAAFGADHGRYYFREVEDLREERTISSSTQLLILEALRQIDEKTNEDTDAKVEI